MQSIISIRRNLHYKHNIRFWQHGKINIVIDQIWSMISFDILSSIFHSIWNHICHTYSDIPSFSCIMMDGIYAEGKDLWMNDERDKKCLGLFGINGYKFCLHFVILFLAMVGPLWGKPGGLKYGWCWNVLQSKLDRNRILLWWLSLSETASLCRNRR